MYFKYLHTLGRYAKDTKDQNQSLCSLANSHKTNANLKTFQVFACCILGLHELISLYLQLFKNRFHSKKKYECHKYEWGKSYKT